MNKLRELIEAGQQQSEVIKTHNEQLQKQQDILELINTKIDTELLSVLSALDVLTEEELKDAINYGAPKHLSILLKRAFALYCYSLKTGEPYFITEYGGAYEPNKYEEYPGEVR